MSLPIALFALIAAFGLATAAILSSIDAQQGTKNDTARKNAIAAADAGANVAHMRLNRYQEDLSEANPCVGPTGASQPETAPGSGWCPRTEPETVGGSTFTYQVSAYSENAQLSVVSVGTSGTVSRRIEVGLISHNGKNVFLEEHLIGEDLILLEGDAEVDTDVGTNGDIEGKGNAYRLCGNARHGVGKSAPDPHCGGEKFEGEKELPELEPPADIATDNSNCRLVPITCTGEEPDEEVDPYTKNRTSSNPWDAAKRTINIQQQADLTMGGADYWVCGLFVRNGRLIMADNAPVRIFVDTPENCGLQNGATQVEVTGNANIISTGYNPEFGEFNVPGIYVLGSPNVSTKVKLCGNSGTNELLLYAPHSDIHFCGAATWIGMVAGETVRLSGNPLVESDPGVKPPEITLSGLWERTRYVECTGATASPPDASC